MTNKVIYNKKCYKNSIRLLTDFILQITKIKYNNGIQNVMFRLGQRKDKDILAQGVYYFTTGLWPFVHRKSFLKLTGPKNDLWLVHTVGSLVTAAGAVFVKSATKKRVTPEIRLLAVGSALGLAAVEIHSVWRGAIRKIYLADTIVELYFALKNALKMR